MGIKNKLQQKQTKLIKELGRRYHSPIPKVLLRTGIVMFIIVLLAINSTYSFLDMLFLLIGTPILIYVALFGYKHFLR